MKILYPNGKEIDKNDYKEIQRYIGACMLAPTIGQEQLSDFFNSNITIKLRTQILYEVVEKGYTFPKKEIKYNYDEISMIYPYFIDWLPDGEDYKTYAILFTTALRTSEYKYGACFCEYVLSYNFYQISSILECERENENRIKIKALGEIVTYDRVEEYVSISPKYVSLDCKNWNYNFSSIIYLPGKKKEAYKKYKKILEEYHSETLSKKEIDVLIYGVMQSGGIIVERKAIEKLFKKDIISTLGISIKDIRDAIWFDTYYSGKNINKRICNLIYRKYIDEITTSDRRYLYGYIIIKDFLKQRDEVAFLQYIYMDREYYLNRIDLEKNCNYKPFIGFEGASIGDFGGMRTCKLTSRELELMQSNNTVIDNNYFSITIIGTSEKEALEKYNEIKNTINIPNESQKKRKAEPKQDFEKVDDNTSKKKQDDQKKQEELKDIDGIQW